MPENFTSDEHSIINRGDALEQIMGITPEEALEPFDDISRKSAEDRLHGLLGANPTSIEALQAEEDTLSNVIDITSYR